MPENIQDIDSAIGRIRAYINRGEISLQEALRSNKVVGIYLPLSAMIRL